MGVYSHSKFILNTGNLEIPVKHVNIDNIVELINFSELDNFAKYELFLILRHIAKFENFTNTFHF